MFLTVNIVARSTNEYTRSMDVVVVVAARPGADQSQFDSCQAAEVVLGKGHTSRKSARSPVVMMYSYSIIE